MFDVEEQLISGKNFRSLEEFVKHKWGTDGLDEYNKQHLFTVGKVQEFKEYPFMDYIRYIEAVSKWFKDDTVAFEIGVFRGRQMGKRNKSKSAKRLVLLDESRDHWNCFNNFGDVLTVRRNDFWMSFIVGMYASHSTYCERTRGFLRGLIGGGQKELCTVDEIRCVTRGDEACEFLVKVMA